MDTTESTLNADKCMKCKLNDHSKYSVSTYKSEKCKDKPFVFPQHVAQTLMSLSCAAPDPMSETLTSTITERHRLFPLLYIGHHNLIRHSHSDFPSLRLISHRLDRRPPGFWWRDRLFPFFCMTNTQFIYSVFINTWFMQIVQNNLHEKEQFERQQSRALMKKPQRKICSRRL